MFTEDHVFKQYLRAFLTYNPNQHIISHVLDKTEGVPSYKGFSIGRVFNVDIQSFYELKGRKIDKLNITADIGLFDSKEKHFDDEIKGIQFELFLVNEDKNSDPDLWLLLDLDDLLFFINRFQNEQAIQQFNFPRLNNCELGGPGFDFINRGRTFANKYFRQYKGPVFDLYYGDEFNELFTIASNALAFLFRSRDRVFEEADLLNNFNYRSTLNLYPRFNNGVAEVAGTIYAAWERIAFVLNEFYPLRHNMSMAPSFKRYITDKVKEAKKDAGLFNPHLDWFNNRINQSHEILENLRHPTVHYNINRSPSGTRAVELMKQRLDDQGISSLKQKWNEELGFLKKELEEFNDGLEQAILLLESWASII